MVDFDYDQIAWGAQKIFHHYTLVGKCNPVEYVVHYGGNAVTGAYRGVEREMQVLRIYEQSHLSRGWRAIAYNYAFGNSGTIYRLRGENLPGATKGANIYTKSILWIGGGAQEPTPAAIAALRDILDGEPMPVFPHSHYRTTQCPGDFWREWLDNYEVGVEEMPRILFEGMIDALFAADGEFQGDPDFWKGLIDDPTNYQWDQYFWPAFTRMVTA